MKAASQPARSPSADSRKAAEASGSSREFGTEARHGEPRRAKPVLDLPQLELDCMKVLWARGEASVRQVWAELSARRSLAYTTIETILDRLARKGVVTRARNGRAFLYRPHFTVEQVRHFALTKLVNNFFAGSASQLTAFLENPDALSLPAGALAPAPPPLARPPRLSRRPAPIGSGRARRREISSATSAAPAIDESLL